MSVFKSSYRNFTVLRIILLSLVLIYSELKKERLRCYYIEWVDSTILVLQYVFVKCYFSPDWMIYNMVYNKSIRFDLSDFSVFIFLKTLTN